MKLVTGRSWVSSPLGVNLLLFMFRNSDGYLENFAQIGNQLKEKTEYRTSTKVFSTPNNKQIELLKEKKNLELLECPQNAVIVWMTNNTQFQNSDLKRHLPTTAQLVLVNVSSFKSAWVESSEDSGTMMKIYNSFSYTQDVNYEARILELPMRDEAFKLVLVVPNKVDLLHTLFRRLANRGLQAAVNSIQPLFTVKSKLVAPSIRFNSEGVFQHKINQIVNVTISHFGNICVNEQGAEIEVLSYLFPTPSVTSFVKPDLSSMHPPFFFGLVFHDTPIYVGQFSYEK